MNNSAQPLLDLFPNIAPYSTGYMAVQAPHEIYWEQCGNPDGTPIVFLHGGPGGGCSDILRRFFDPNHYRIILFDQRGCGRSTPHACLTDNTPEALVHDIKQLREHLNIAQWHVFGGSWGSTLALLYASKQADKIISMILRGIFLMEAADIHWFMYQNQYVFPEAWEQFANIIPENKRDNLLDAYYERLTSKTKEIQINAAVNWYQYESACAYLTPRHDSLTTQEQKDKAVSLALLECHYFKHYMIKPEDSLVKKVDVFRHIPTTIIQGRYDMVCPIAAAHKLHKAWPEADYIIVPDAGHSALDPPIRSHLIAATERAKSIY